MATSVRLITLPQRPLESPDFNPIDSLGDVVKQDIMDAQPKQKYAANV